MNGLALITDMESIKVGNKDFMPDGRKLSSRHLVLTEGLSPCECVPMIPEYTTNRKWTSSTFDL